MQKKPLEEELVFYPSKLQNIVLLIISMFFIILGIIGIMKGENYTFNLIGILFFGFGGLVTIRELVVNKSYLKIQTKGFEYSISGKTTFIKWDDIQEFKFQKIRMMKLVGWLYTSENQKKDMFNSSSRKLTGIDEVLPDSYGLGHKKLMKIMVEYWTEYHNKI